MVVHEVQEFAWRRSADIGFENPEFDDCKFGALQNSLGTLERGEFAALQIQFYSVSSSDW